MYTADESLGKNTGGGGVFAEIGAAGMQALSSCGDYTSQ